MVHNGDTLRDMEIDKDRQVFVGDDKDMSQIEGIPVVKQSLVINAGNVLRGLVGEPVTAKRLQRVESRLKRALNNDPQTEDVKELRITTIDKANNNITVTVYTDVRHDFQIEEIL